jgi:hypothetical protein
MKTQYTNKPMVQEAQLEVPDSRTILVSLDYPPPFNGFISGMQYLNSALSPSLTNPAKLLMAPGIYNEIALATVECKAGTIIEGASAFATQVVLLNPTAAFPFLTIEGYFEISAMQITALRLSTPSGSVVPPNNTIAYMPNPFSALICRNVGFTGADKVIHCANFGCIVAFSGAWGIFATLADDSNPDPNEWLYITLGTGIHIDGPSRCILTGTGAVTNDIVTQGFPIPPYISQPYNYGVLVQNGGFLDATGIQFEAGLVAVRAENGLNCHIVGGTMINCVNGVEILNTPTALYSIQTQLNTGIDLTIEDEISPVVSTGCSFNTDKLSLPSNVENISLQYFDDSLDNERGFHTIGNMIVGDIKHPAEVFLGNGSTNIQDLVVLQFDGATYTDITASMSPSDLTPALVFDSGAIGDITYVGNDTHFSGLRVDISTIMASGAVFPTLPVSVQYWDGLAWVEFTHMSAQHFFPHASHANNLFSVIEQQDIRFNNDIVLGETVVNGITKYWMRFVVTTTLTTNPALLNMKIFGSTTLFTFDGFQLYYGKARPVREVAFDTSWIVAKNPGAPTSQNVWASKNLWMNRDNNSYAPGEIATFAFYVPATFDSSTPLHFEFAFISDNIAATQADFQFNLIYACYLEGQPMFTTSAAAPATTVEETTLLVALTPDQTAGNNLAIQRVDVDLSYCRASIAGNIEEILMFRMERLVDGNANNCVFTNIGIFQTVYLLGLAASV